MSDFDETPERPRALRALRERATVYRAVSAPTAFVGGLLSLGAFATAYYAKHHRHANLTPRQFVVVWLVVLALTGLTSLLFLGRAAAQRGERLFSPGMKCALLSVAPSFLLAGLLTLLIHKPIQLGIIWMVLYGLGLLATQLFAPRSLVVLGVVFFVAGSALMVTWKHLFLAAGQVEPSTLVVSGIMAGAFGGIHLAYAAVVWALGEETCRGANPAEARELRPT